MDYLHFQYTYTNTHAHHKQGVTVSDSKREDSFGYGISYCIVGEIALTEKTCDVGTMIKPARYSHFSKRLSVLLKKIRHGPVDTAGEHDWNTDKNGPK